jgi:hypothetical protein
MSARNYVQAIGAGATIRLPAGRYFYVKSAAAVLDIETWGNTGAPVRFTGVPAGSKFGPVQEGQGWRYLLVTSAAAQNIELIISDDGNFEIASAVTVVGGVVTAEAPYSTIADTADVTQASGTETVIAANLSRRMIEIGVLSTAGNGVRVSQAGGANTRGHEIQPGTSKPFETTAALIVRNANISADASDAVWWSEEYA